jgi:hypothetical protein
MRKLGNENFPPIIRLPKAEIDMGPNGGFSRNLKMCRFACEISEMASKAKLDNKHTDNLKSIAKFVEENLSKSQKLYDAVKERQKAFDEIEMVQFEHMEKPKDFEKLLNRIPELNAQVDLYYNNFVPLDHCVGLFHASLMEITSPSEALESLLGEIEKNFDHGSLEKMKESYLLSSRNLRTQMSLEYYRELLSYQLRYLVTENEKLRRRLNSACLVPKSLAVMLSEFKLTESMHDREDARDDEVAEIRMIHYKNFIAHFILERVKKITEEKPTDKPVPT